MLDSSQLAGYVLTSLWSLLNIAVWVGIGVLIVLFAKKRLVFVPKKTAAPKSKES